MVPPFRPGWMLREAPMSLLSPKRIGIAIALLVAALLGWHLLWGRLVPLSGVFIGFKLIESKRAIVFFHADQAQAKVVSELTDELAPAVSASVGSEPRHRIEIVLCSSEREYRRFTGSSARFITMSGRIFVSSRAIADASTGTIHLRTYLAHELTHALLAQYQSLIVQLKFPAWLSEGFATLTAEQMGVDGYFDMPAVRSWLCQGRSVPPSDYVGHSRTASVAALPESGRYHFIYSEFAFYVQNLIEKYGRERFLRYLGAVGAGENWVKAFKQEFGIAPDSSFDDFRRESCAAGSPS